MLRFVTRALALFCLVGLTVAMGQAALDLSRTPTLSAETSDDSTAIPARSEPPIRDTPSELRVRKVVLFSSGVGYFQRDGEIEGNAQIELEQPAENINDLIKSLILEDSDGFVDSLRYDSPEPIEQTLRSFALDLSQNPTFGQILDQARGELVEVSLAANGQLPAQITGTVVGMEMRPNGDKQMMMLNLLSAEGIRSFPLELVQRLRFLDPELEREFRQALQTVSKSHDRSKKTVRIGFRGDGKRAVKVGYVVDHPIWKSSYRVVFDDDGQARLQAWGTIENTTDEDWENVRLVLVSGRPISFRMNLYDPLFVPRPEVEPELFASLRPPVFEGPLMNDPLLDDPATAQQFGNQGMGGGVFNSGFGGQFGQMGFQGGFGGGGFGVGGGFGGGFQGQVQANLGAGGGVFGQHGQFGNGQWGYLGNPSLGNTNGIRSPRLSFDEWQQRRQQTHTSGGLGLPPLNGDAADPKPVQDGTIAAQSQLGKTFAEMDSNVLDAATADLGSPVRFAVEEELSLPRQQSASVKLFEIAIPTERLSIYNHDVQAKHPLMGLKMKNTSKQALMQGPITVYEHDEYAGDARVMDLQPDEERLISYAVDLTTEVKRELRQEPGPVILARIVNGKLQVQFTQRKIAEYTIRNRSSEDKLVIVEQPVTERWKLTVPEKADETSRDVYRFHVRVPAGKTLTHIVAEERPTRETFEFVQLPTRSGFPTTLGIDLWTTEAAVPENDFEIHAGPDHGIVLKHRNTRTLRYFVHNRNAEARTVIIEHVLNPDTTEIIATDREPIDMIEKAQHFKFEVKPDETASLAITSRHRGFVAETLRHDQETKQYRHDDVAIALEVSDVRCEDDILDGGRLKGDALTLFHRTDEQVEYAIHNLADVPRTLTLTYHPRERWDFTDPKQVEAVSLAVEPEAIVKATYGVTQSTEKESRLTELDVETAARLAKSESLSEKLRTAIAEGHRLHVASVEANEALRIAKADEKAIIEEQERLRINLEKLPQDSPLYKRYIDKLDEAETELESKRTRLRELTMEASQAEEALTTYLRGRIVD